MLVYFTWPTKRPGGHQSQLTIIKVSEGPLRGVFWETVGKIWETVSLAQNAFKKHWYWTQQSGKSVLSFDSIDTVNTALLLELSLFIDVAATWRLLHPCGFKQLRLLECKLGLQRFDIRDSAHAHNLLLHLQPTQLAVVISCLFSRKPQRHNGMKLLMSMQSRLTSCGMHFCSY